MDYRYLQDQGTLKDGWKCLIYRYVFIHCHVFRCLSAYTCEFWQYWVRKCEWSRIRNIHGEKNKCKCSFSLYNHLLDIVMYPNLCMQIGIAWKEAAKVQTKPRVTRVYYSSSSSCNTDLQNFTFFF